MRAALKVAVALSAGLALSACSSETTATPGTSASSSSITRQASGSYTDPISVENQLKDWWGGPGIPITWKVSEIDDDHWDGNSRPDHAPPDGFQGLVQKPFAGPYVANLETYAMFFDSARFVLTPVITIDGQEIELQPIVVIPQERMSTTGFSCVQRFNGNRTSEVASLSQKTPRGLLVYDVVLNCGVNSGDVERILIRNYQKS